MPDPTEEITNIADDWLEAMLSADLVLQAEVPGGWHSEAADDGTPYPLGRYVYQGGGRADAGGSLYNIGGRDIFTRLLYLVTVTGQNVRFKDLGRAAAQIKSVINLKSGSTPNGDVLWCEYRGPFRERVPIGDQFYPELGGFYELAVRATL